MVDYTSIESFLRQIPTVAAIPCEDLEFRLLSGLTNRTIMVTDRRSEPKQKYVLRIPGAGTEKLINRVAERNNSQHASSLGINVPVLYFDDTGLELMRFIPSVTYSTSMLLGDHARLCRAVGVLRSLHVSGRAFVAGNFDSFQTIAHYMSCNISHQYEVPELLQQHYPATVDAIRASVGERHLVPCHNDLVPENFLEAAAEPGSSALPHLYLIDWEYSGLNDFWWDLASLSCELDFGREQDAMLLGLYFERPPTALEQTRLLQFKVLVDFTWSAWSCFMHGSKNCSQDHWSYGLRRLARAVENTSRPEFLAQ
eukprot:gnl/Spiro4/5628_TR2868_c0_g1_i1.p1 gnl/Spiro4/5628_TR2868_c0_g1~~gnl/Spiro4/5628_TR2868_c0_g1_i1.p1  ORF type:complete len:312 (-),score=43.27 gnl/Spiro4/5628_TR2868_c0_g1_i1:117-1052(-)